MFSKVLTKNFAAIDTFVSNPKGMLSKAENGILAIFSNNIPVFYAVSSERLTKLLALEASLSRQENDVTLDTQFFQKTIPSNAPIGKFAMYREWKPDADFQRYAALWGIILTYPVTQEELMAFINWWQAEEKFFTHMQWQQKLARNVQIRRTKGIQCKKQNINIFSQPDTKIPHGFRGAK